MNKFDVVTNVGAHPEPTGPSHAPTRMDKTTKLRLVHYVQHDDPALRTGRRRAR
jgi:hypothetical protein